MRTVLMGNKFPTEVVADMFDKVRGKSSIAKLSNQMPVAFTGNSIFTFNMEGDVSIVAEGGAKPEGNSSVEPVKIQPVKVVYQSRFSDEFMTASAEYQLEVLRAFSEGFAKKLAVGLDKMAMHGVNPATGTTSALITSYLDQVTNKVVYTTGKGDEAIEDAIALLGDYDATGIALSKTLASAMAKEVDGANRVKFPELAWGGQPNAINGITTDVNSTVSSANDDLAIVGDFSAFKWGYSKEIPVEVIQYGSPDGGADLKNTNEIVLRGEAFIGFAVLDKDAFARVTSQ